MKNKLKEFFSYPSFWRPLNTYGYYFITGIVGWVLLEVMFAL